MITEKNIRKIPKYMLEKIKKTDSMIYPKPNGKTRFYKYFTKYKNELCEVLVAVRNKYKKWYCKQVVVHGIHNDKCYLQDIGRTMGFYLVGWYREKLSNYSHWYDYDWGWQYDKYFNLDAPIVNLEYVLQMPQYKYSAIDKYVYNDKINYLRNYEKYPQCELLVKAGLSKFIYSKILLKQCVKDKKFCKWIYANKDELKNGYYINSIIRAYKQNKNIKEVYLQDYYKQSFARNDNDGTLKMVFQNDIDNFVKYLIKQNIDAYLYRDYLDACLYLQLDMSLPKNRYPHDFKRWHDIRIDEKHSKEAELDKEKRKQLYKQFSKVSKKYLTLQRDMKDKYITLIAKSPADLINEGNKLHHCVGRMGYDQKFAKEQTLIFFIRLKDDKDTPLVTLEYSLENHKILQCYGDNDTKPSDEIMNYVKRKWLPYANKKIRQIAI